MHSPNPLACGQTALRHMTHLTPNVRDARSERSSYPMGGPLADPHETGRTFKGLR
jgi:hypothetical protein